MIHGYCRVSTPTQVEGWSPETQAKKIQDYARDNDLGEVQVWTDPGTSGSVPLAQRPAGQLMCSQLRAGDHVIVTRLDRAWRSILDAHSTIAQWKERNVVLHVTEMGVDLSTPHGSLVFSVLVAFAEFERVLIRERILEGVRTAMTERGPGMWGPAAPYGFRREGMALVERQEEADVLRRIVQGRRVGRSYNDLAADLNINTAGAGAQTTREGLQWTGERVREALRNLRAFYERNPNIRLPGLERP